jgi:hypothetical protein
MVIISVFRIEASVALHDGFCVEIHGALGGQEGPLE